MITNQEVTGLPNTSVVTTSSKKEVVNKLVTDKRGKNSKHLVKILKHQSKITKPVKIKEPPLLSGLYHEVIIDKFKEVPYLVIQTSKRDYVIKLGVGPKALIIPFQSNKKSLTKDVQSDLKGNF
jgi:hypothetical protein